VGRAHHYRSAVRVYETVDGHGLLSLGRGLGGRWEAGFEVKPGCRNHGLGRALVAASRYLIEPGEGMFMQAAIGNIASLRAIIAGGFAPVGAEVLYYSETSAG
jgi:GNAT superfamily N-acetyltransferase